MKTLMRSRVGGRGGGRVQRAREERVCCGQGREEKGGWLFNWRGGSNGAAKRATKEEGEDGDGRLLIFILDVISAVADGS